MNIKLIFALLMASSAAADAACKARAADIKATWYVTTNNGIQIVLNNTSGEIAFTADGLKYYTGINYARAYDVEGGKMEVASNCKVTGTWDTSDAATEADGTQYTGVWTIIVARMTADHEVINGILMEELGVGQYRGSFGDFTAVKR